MGRSPKTIWIRVERLVLNTSRLVKETLPSSLMEESHSRMTCWLRLETMARWNCDPRRRVGESDFGVNKARVDFLSNSIKVLGWNAAS